MGTDATCREVNRLKLHCYACGRPIRFVRMKSGKAIPADYDPVYFVPESGGETFLTSDGDVARGRRAFDGRTGYRPHICTQQKPAAQTDNRPSPER